jgi:transmembrane sensor
MNGTGKSPENYQIEDFITDESFINYFFRLNGEDVSFWTKWLLAHPENAGLAEMAREMLQNLSLTLPEEEFEAELGKLRKALHADTESVHPATPAIIRLLQEKSGARRPGSTRSRLMTRLKYILPITLILIAGAIFFLNRISTEQSALTVKINDSNTPVVFTLSDGSVVTLAPQGVLRFPADFGKQERKVYLEGEAQFQVQRYGTQPFRVFAGGIVATVLGTKFNVNDQSRDSAVLVELIKGRLRVETIPRSGLAVQSIVLEPDERVVYRRQLERMYKEKWQSQHDPALPDRLVFRKNSFEEIARQIKAVYGVTVINRSGKENWHFTGEFAHATAKEIIENICLIEGLTSQVNEDSILIK